MIGEHTRRAHRLWKLWTDSDHGLAAMLALLALYIFVIYPLVGADAIDGGLVSISFSLILVAGIVATATHHMIRIGVVVLTTVALAAHWAHVVIGGRDAHIVATAAALVFFAVQAWHLSIRVFGRGTVNIYRILGAVAVYLVIGLLWANAYLLLYLLNPESMRFAPGSQRFEPPISEMVYYSFVTLTTVGYGDIVPVHPFARSLANLEGLIGQLYPAILLARLVTQYQGHRPKD
jgi:hypothetical protein